MGRRVGTPIRATSSVVTTHTAANIAPLANLVANFQPTTAKTLASGELSAGVLKSLVTVTGAGRFKWLSCYTADTTSRTIRVKVTVDGTAAVDVTSAATTTSGAGLIIAGMDQEGAGPEIVWNTSLDVSIASSVDETDKLTVGYIYLLEQ